MRGTNQVCGGCGDFKALENYDLMLCPSCNRKARKEESTDLYPEVRKMFLTMCVNNDVKCPVYGTPITMDSDIHHKKGRHGYADQKAKEDDTPLLIDPRFFLAVSRVGHQWIEENVSRAMERGFTLTRQDTII